MVFQFRVDGQERERWVILTPKTRQEKTDGPNGAKRNTEQAKSLNRQKNIKFKRGMNFK